MFLERLVRWKSKRWEFGTIIKTNQTCSLRATIAKLNCYGLPRASQTFPNNESFAQRPDFPCAVQLEHSAKHTSIGLCTASLTSTGSLFSGSRDSSIINKELAHGQRAGLWCRIGYRIWKWRKLQVARCFIVPPVIDRNALHVRLDHKVFVSIAFILKRIISRWWQRYW